MRGALRIIRAFNRKRVAEEVMRLPEGFEVIIREPKRTLDQNALMWAMLSDISTACPDGRQWSPEVWKSAFMQRLGHEIRWVQGLDNDPLPVGFRSSRLTKAQMGDLITVIQQFAAENGVTLTQPEREEA